MFWFSYTAGTILQLAHRLNHGAETLSLKTDRRIDKQTDRQTDRKIDRKIDRQADRKKER